MDSWSCWAVECFMDGYGAKKMNSSSLGFQKANASPLFESRKTAQSFSKLNDASGTPGWKYVHALSKACPYRQELENRQTFEIAWNQQQWIASCRPEEWFWHNGRKKRSAVLKCGDWIRYGRTDYLFLETLLLSVQKQEGFQILSRENLLSAQENLLVQEENLHHLGRLSTSSASGPTCKTEDVPGLSHQETGTMVLNAPGRSASCSNAEAFQKISACRLPGENLVQNQAGYVLKEEALDFSALDPVEIEAEAPSTIAPGAAPHWFSSMGPACMIFASSLVGGVMNWIQNPADIQAVFGSMSSSLSMAAAFLGFGLINRKITARQAQAPAETNRRLYEAFLSQSAAQMDLALEKAQARYARQSRLLASWDLYLAGPAGENWQLPAGFGFVSAARIKMPAIRYDQKEDPLVLRLEQIGRKQMQAPRWFCLHPQEVLFVQSFSADYLDGLFGVWCWMLFDRRRKFAWIGKSWKPRLLHTGVVLDHKLLCFEKLGDFLQMVRSHPGYEWLAVLEEEEPVELAGISWLVQKRGPESIQPAALPAWNEAAVRESSLHGLNQKQEPDDPLLLSGVQADVFRKQSANLQVNLDGSNVLDFFTMGPHALIAGTTGSGKSEGMTHILLQLSLQNSSKALQYILIDFKGGAFGSVFYEFPHLAGSLTNMEAGSIERLEQALDLELKNRQQAIAVMMEKFPYATASLQSYNEYCPDQTISELFIIVDEFAQLKQECPDFLKKLQETARIGRSLGIHLILATQKPAGVVDAQTFANARIRLCFMVQSSSDSREVLGHERAAYLKNPGEYICEISSLTSMQGTMTYTRAPIPGEYDLRLTSKGKCLYQSPPALTRLEKTAQLILSQQETRRWILHPDLHTATTAECGLIVDHLTRLEAYCFMPGKHVWIQLPKSRQKAAASSLAAAWSGPVYCVGFEMEEADETIRLECLWQAGELEHALIFIQPASVPPVLLEKLLKLKNSTSIVLCDENLQKLQPVIGMCPVRLACSLSEKEEQYLLFGRGTDSIPQWPLVFGMENQQPFRAAFCRPEDVYRKVRFPLRKWICNPMEYQDVLSMPAGLLGFESIRHYPVYWDRCKPLLIAYSQPRLKTAIETLLSVWKQQDSSLTTGSFLDETDVSVIALHEQASLLNTPQAAQELYNRQICYVGSGIRDYQYVLKLPTVLVQEGNGVLFGKEAVWMHMLEIRCT